MNYKIFSYTNFKYADFAICWASYMDKLNVNYEVQCCDEDSYQYLMDKNVPCSLSEFLYKEAGLSSLYLENKS